MRILALLAVRDEIRYVDSVLEHLVDQGAEIAVIDNGSTDGTRDVLSGWLGRGVVRIDDQPWTGAFELETQLRMKERLAAELEADWYVHVDADERRYAPRPYAILADGLADAAAHGFNAVDFDEFVFVPTAEDPSFEGRDFATAMRWYYHYDPDTPAGLRINAWRRQDVFDLVSTGGHHVRFAGQRVFPRQFVMRHYPVLSAEHAIEKYGTRAFAAAELSRSWHGDRAAFNGERLVLPSRSQLKEVGPNDDPDPTEPWGLHPFLDADAGPKRQVARPDPDRAAREQAVMAYARRHRAHVAEIPRVAGAGRRPFWSVMFPVRDPRPEHFAEALRSVLAQDPGPEQMEIVVVDDASSADVAELVTSVGQGRVGYLRHDERRGLPGNWNAAVTEARGEVVHLHAQDDRVMPGFYDRLRRALVRDPALVGAYCRIAGFADHGITFIQPPERADPGIVPDLAVKEAESHRVLVPGVVLRRSTYETLGGYRDDLPYCTDWDLVKRATILGPFWYEPLVLAHWRRHDAQETARLQATGADLVDRRRSIELTASLLAPDQRARVRSSALRDSVVWSVQRLHELVEDDALDAALAQAREIVITLELSRGDRAPAGSGDTVGTASFTDGNREDTDRIAELEAQVKGWVAAVRRARSATDQGEQ